jgi:hypothetical protein
VQIYIKKDREEEEKEYVRHTSERRTCCIVSQRLSAWNMLSRALIEIEKIIRKCITIV